jgi:pimeloyl-ACP methyl ester carboxylesterase
MKDATFVLIPGAGGSAWYWHLVEPKLRERGYEAISVTLPAADDSAGLVDYAAAVVHAVGKKTSRRLVLVAQSLGGFTAPLVCEHVPMSLLITVNAMIPKPGETPGKWWSNTGHAEAKREQNIRDGRDIAAPFDPLSEFFHDVPQRVIDEAWAQGEPGQSNAVFNSKCEFAH